MIIYLLSYPRSGNSRFTSTIEWWGGWKVADHPVRAHLVRTFPGTTEDPLPADPYDMAKDPDNLYFIKVHDWGFWHFARGIGGKILYIIRDGRDVVVSYAHYIHTHRKPDWPENVQGSVEDIMKTLANGEFHKDSEKKADHSWGLHVRQAHARGVEMIRYEDITHHGVLDLLKDHHITVANPAQGWSFKALHEAYPKQYRRGRERSWFDEMTLMTLADFMANDDNRAAMEIYNSLK